jgi:O-antigen ligase
MMQYAVRLALMNPLSGVGVNLSPYFLAVSFPFEKFVFDPTYPHNLVFELLAETGIIGVTLFTLFVYLSFGIFYKKHGRSHQLNEFGVAATVYLACAQVYPLFLNRPEIFSYLFLYLGLMQISSKDNYYES